MSQNPKFLTTNRAVDFFSYVASGTKTLQISDLKKIFGKIPQSTPLVYWACQSLPHTTNLVTAIDYYKEMFGESYKKEIVKDITLYAKSFPILDINVVHFLDKLYIENGGLVQEFRSLAFKELAKKHQQYLKENINIEPLLEEHIKVLVQYPKTIKIVTKFVENKPLLNKFVTVTANYTKLSQDLSAKGNKKNLTKV